MKSHLQPEALSSFFKNKSILLIDDDPHHIENLELTDFHILICHDKSQAIKILNTESIDMILLNVLMTSFNGFEFCQFISSSADHQAIPIIMILTQEQLSLRVKGYSNGAVDYLVKPFLKEEFLLRINNHFKIYKEKLLEELIEQLQNELGTFIQAEQELKASEDRYHQMFESNLAIKLIIDPTDGQILDANKAACSFYGYEKKVLTTMSITDINQLNDEEVKAEMNKAKSEERLYFNFRHQLSNGDIKDVEVYSGPVKSGDSSVLYSIIHDITARKNAEREKLFLEKQLRQSQKMETIGTLARGIAHDFNNILTPIMGYTEMALLSLDKKHPLIKHLNRILKGTHRARELIEQILLFSKKIEKEWLPISLPSLINEALKLLRPSIPRTVEIIQEINESCPPIKADETQIHQVIVNLCTNAWQAMEQDGGQLTIKLDYNQNSFKRDINQIGLPEAAYACLSIYDTGVGMDEMTQERIFEPFFTTKPVDKGNGLGLSVVHGIIRSHKGGILVKSQIGKGSSFHVYLPLIDSYNLAKSAEPQDYLRGQEHILIVDDEEDVLIILKDILEMFNYKVDTFLKASSALKAFKSEPDKYNLLITDLTMPQMNGIELISEINRTHDLPIIVMTGFGDDLTETKINTYNIQKVLSKPITIKTLTNEVRAILDKS